MDTLKEILQIVRSEVELLPVWFRTGVLVILLLWFAKRFFGFSVEGVLEWGAKELKLLIETIRTGRWTVGAANALFIIVMTLIGVLLIAAEEFRAVINILTPIIGNARAMTFEGDTSFIVWIIVTGFGGMASLWLVSNNGRYK